MDVLIFFLFIVFMIISYGQQIYSLFNHHEWRPNSKPDPNACIINISSEKVTYLKNKTKFKTTVLFSDGFVFYTHDTDRTDHFFSYSISVNDAKIRDKAIDAHRKALLKANK